MEKRAGYYSVAISLAMSIVFVLIFYVLASFMVSEYPEIYGPVDMYGGMAYVFLLSMIVALSIWPGIMEKMQGYYGVVISLATSIVFVLIFYVLASSMVSEYPEIYGQADMYGGMAYVFLLSMIVALSIWPGIMEKMPGYYGLVISLAMFIIFVLIFYILASSLVSEYPEIYGPVEMYGGMAP